MVTGYIGQANHLEEYFYSERLPFAGTEDKESST